jgi:hypothetical protein
MTAQKRKAETSLRLTLYKFGYKKEPSFDIFVATGQKMKKKTQDSERSNWYFEIFDNYCGPESARTESII